MSAANKPLTWGAAFILAAVATWGFAGGFWMGHYAGRIGALEAKIERVSK